MKLSKNLGRIATTFVAGAMLTALAMPAYADSNLSGGAVNNDDNSPLAEIVFTKNLVEPADVETPNVTFTFNLTGVAPDPAGETVTDTSTMEVSVSSGVDHGSLTDVTVIFDKDSVKTGSTEGLNATKTVSEDVTLALTDDHGFTFSAPGVYKYELTEEPVDGYTTSDPYYVYLYVERIEGGQADQYVITGATLSAAKENSDKKNNITNYYLVGEDGTVTPNTLTIDNDVTGEMGNKSNPFSFEITITAKNSDVNRNYAVSGATVKNNNDGTYTIAGTMTDGQSIVINGLISGDTYKINQKDANADGYNTSITFAGLENDDTFVNNSTVVTFDATNADTIHYTNTRNAIAPTGLVMNVAPYVLLVLVAAGAGYVFLRKREED